MIKMILRIAAFVSVGLVVVVTVLVLSFSIRLPLHNGTRVASGNECRFLKWERVLNRTQTLSSCGPYSTRVFIYEKTGEIIDPELINREMPCRIKNGLTLPWGIVRYLRHHDLRASVYLFILCDNGYYINWIKNRIDRNDPVIVTLGRSRHYVTVVGYENDEAYVYDPAWFGNNGNAPGNRKLGFHDPLFVGERVRFGITIN